MTNIKLFKLNMHIDEFKNNEYVHDRQYIFYTMDNSLSNNDFEYAYKYELNRCDKLSCDDFNKEFLDGMSNFGFDLVCYNIDEFYCNK